ncbi:hypothetical protein [Hyphomicrobium sp.]|uniref:polysaccharide deacetylase family protein n=1 Tax=Hyphomicrobium sp. TaxID=82 RepID=UPI002E31F1B9|nr:hypothetical protein [Hyphomicrobium sp.]HEX2839982.1 hypothetical protein [Hyphomicrobium sp.]
MRRIAFGILSVLLWTLAAWPIDPARADGVVRREILALYDSDHESDVANSRLHRFAEMPLNHLGYHLLYHDVNEPLPEPKSLMGYAGVMSWFADPLKNPFPFLGWASKVVRQGTKFVILGETGADPTGTARVALNMFVGSIGLGFTSGYVSTTFGTRVLVKDASMIGFEHDLDPTFPSYPITEIVARDVQPLLSVQAPRRDRDRRSILVATSPRGGYAAFGYEFFPELQSLELGQWIINPFEFFRRAFGSGFAPIPDVTTVSGRRIYFSHVDGDGWNNVTTVDRELPRGVLSAEMMLDELIAPFPDLPVTVALIGGDVDPRLGGSPEARNIARRIFALPQVEVGSHTYTHPFNWEFFASYNRNREIALVKENTPEPGLANYLQNFRAVLGFGHRHRAGDYVAGSADLPRAFMRDPFVLEQEIAGSLALAESLAPHGKRTMVLQWSGNTRPFEDAIKATRASGVLNINGGDSRFDSSYPSVAYVPPIGRAVGRERQIYAVNSNENTYTNGWTSNFAGQQQLSQTLDNTELPRRLKGMNVYYHVYSAERRASLDVVKSFLMTARSSSIAPITTSHYAAMANGFFSTQIAPLEPQVWSIANRGALETVRFDDAEEHTLDLGRSHGVLGQNRHAGSLYVALDPDVLDPIVALNAGKGGPTGGASLAESRWRLRELARGDCGFRYRTHGFGPGEFVWEGLTPGAGYQITAERAERETWTAKVEADDEGKLEYTLPIKDMSRFVNTNELTTVRVECVP